MPADPGSNRARDGLFFLYLWLQVNRENPGVSLGLLSFNWATRRLDDVLTLHLLLCRVRESVPSLNAPWVYWPVTGLVYFIGLICIYSQKNSFSQYPQFHRIIHPVNNVTNCELMVKVCYLIKRSRFNYRSLSIVLCMEALFCKICHCLIWWRTQQPKVCPVTVLGAQVFNEYH